jgi:hypothetical protein
MRNTTQALLDPTPRTASGDSGVIDTSGGNENMEHSVRVFLDVAAPTGTTPTLNVFVYGVVNGKNYLLFQFTQVTTAASRQTQRIDNVPRDVLVAWTITGTTPSYTFEVGMVR